MSCSTLLGERKTGCRVFLLDDTVWEGVETFRLVLRNPSNALPGAQTSTLVAIDDPEDGRFLFSWYLAKQQARVDFKIGYSPSLLNRQQNNNV